MKSLSIINKALLSMWSWCYTTEKEILWKRIINGKYEEEEGGWCSKEVREGFGVSVWKAKRNGGL